MIKDNSKIIIRVATETDIGHIKTLIEEGKRKMIASGNLHQWSASHPSIEQLHQDILNGNSYLVIDVANPSSPLATFAAIASPEPTYTVIEEGQWLNDASYYVIHRVASAPNTHGVMRAIINFVFTLTNNIRIDTHADNILMRSALERLGFTYCGIIYLENGDTRVAYQKIKE